MIYFRPLLCVTFFSCVVGAAPADAQPQRPSSRLEASSTTEVRSISSEDLGTLDKEAILALRDSDQISRDGVTISVGEVRVQAEARTAILQIRAKATARLATEYLQVLGREIAESEPGRREAEIAAANASIEQLRKRTQDTKLRKPRTVKRVN